LLQTPFVLLVIRGCLPRRSVKRRSGDADLRGGFREILAEGALIEFCDGRAFELVAFVQECDAEGVADVLEDFRVQGRPAPRRAWFSARAD